MEYLLAKFLFPKHQTMQQSVICVTYATKLLLHLSFTHCSPLPFNINHLSFQAASATLFPFPPITNQFRNFYLSLLPRISCQMISLFKTVPHNAPGSSATAREILQGVPVKQFAVHNGHAHQVDIAKSVGRQAPPLRTWW